MSGIDALVLPESHARALRNTLVEVLEFVDIARELLELDASHAEEERAVTLESASEILSRVAELESAARELMERFALRAASRNIRGELRGYSSRTWADLLDCRSGAMQRYGPPPDGYAQMLDPVVERMASLAHEVLFFSREPGPR